MDHDHDRAVRDARATRLVEFVVAPADRLHDVGDGTGPALVDEGDTVGEPQHTGGPTLEFAAVGDASLDDKGVTAADLGVAGGGGVEVGVVPLP